MSLERNTLMEQVYPRLKDYCREKHGLEFQVVDMRWGVRDEATDDHMTTELCMKEIKNCQRLSMGPNFVVFLGQKYGYRPIPTCIDGEEFVKFRSILKQKHVDVSLMDLWYKEDTNSVPSVYVLQPISSILKNFNNKKDPKLQSKDQTTWWDTLSKLQILLRRAAQSLFAMKRIDEDVMHNYMMSVTEREVINGILNVPHTRSTCLAYVRQINNINMTYVREVCKFVDMAGRVVDMEAQNLLSDLRDRRLPDKMKKPNYIKFDVEWEGREGLNVQAHHDYLVQFTHHFFKHIKKLVDKAMQRAYLTQQSPVVTEMLQHLHMCNTVVKVFQGRAKELQKLQEYVQGNSRTPLILHGIGGCGKTSLLAKAASLVTSWIKSKAVLVIRFIGTTPDSSTLLPLLTTICQQIAYNYSLPWQEMPGEIIPLVAHLKSLLCYANAEYPLYIFIDSLDQLSGSNNAVKVTWLPIILPPHVKMVITADSDEESPTFAVLHKMYEENTTFIEVKPLHSDLATRILKLWLSETNRTLKDHQWKLVKSVILKCSLPIFVKLVYAEVCRWKSYTPEKDTSLTFTVVDSIMNFIEKVEIQHGTILVSHAFAYITASKSGLSEIELEDLISLDDIVLEDVYQYHLPPVRRIPPLLWTRIRNDIPSYLSEREADGITVLNWYHRQFRNAATMRYLDNSNSLCFFHSSIADYFLGTWGGGKPKPFKYSELQRMRFGLYSAEGEADRKVPLQPLVFESNEKDNGENSTGVRYNLRRMSELPFHLIRSHRRTDLFGEVLFNYNWLYYKLCSFPISAVLADFEDAKENMNDREKDTLRELNLVADSLRLGRSVLADYPQMVGPQITGRLLPVKDSYKNIKSLIYQCDQEGPKNCGLVPAYHCFHTPGGPMKYSLEGHPFAVFGFCFTSDSRYVISASNRFIICDVTTSDITQDIDPEIEGIMMDVQRTDDDRYAVAYTNYNLILILNVLNGEVLKVSLMDREKERFLTGINVGYSIFSAWSDTRWFFFGTNSGDILEQHVVQEENASVLCINPYTLNNYDIILNRLDSSTGNCYQLLQTMKERKVVSSLTVDGALAFNAKRSKVFLVEKDKGLTEISNISLYTKLNEGWSFQRIVVKSVAQILSLSFDDTQELLSGVLVTKFMIWYVSNGTGISYCLPDSVRNISMRPLQAQSSMIVTQNNQFVVGAVRKQLYIWTMKSGHMLRVLDAHFGRILRMRSLKLDDFSGFATSSLDRSLKVWNVRNLFEDSHIIDRMDMPVESISMDSRSKLAITMTRSSIGVWNLVTGKLIVRLSDSQIGAIITHALITADGRFILCVESGIYIVWSVENRCVLCREAEAKVKNLTLISRDTRALILSKEDDEQEAHITCRSVPDGGVTFWMSFPVTVLRSPVVTANGKFLVISTFDKGEECLAMYNPRRGEYLHKFPIPKEQVKSFKYLVPIPSTSPIIGLFEDYKAIVVDVSSKKIIRIISRWNSVFSRNGKLGLYAPSEGGLDILELRHGKLVKTLLAPVAEGVFSVKAFFSANNKYVIYYHSGRNTIRVFRVCDGKMIANYRLSAEVHAVEGTPDGLGVVVGGADGTLTLLFIVDTDDPETSNRLSELPSRTEVGETVGNVAVTFKSTARQIMKVSLPLKSKEGQDFSPDNG